MFSRIKKIFIEYRELKHLAYHDSLTGLLNRNWLYKNILSIKLKYVYFIDINNLHIINLNGHTIGDKHINKCVKSIILNDDDILMRYAGDEFIIFSNTIKLIESNQLFTVGFSIAGINIGDAINEADMDMIKQKSSKQR